MGDDGTSYEQSWGDAFFGAPRDQINDIEIGGCLSSQVVEKLRLYSFAQEAMWVEPTEFVLSHLDGFQAIATRRGGHWVVDAMLDVEDHQFTDQRFVLRGHELAMEVEGQSLQDEFWEGYTSRENVDPTFRQFRPLFKLYYLSVWLCVFKDENIGFIPHREEKAARVEQMIRSLL